VRAAPPGSCRWPRCVSPSRCRSSSSSLVSPHRPRPFAAIGRIRRAPTPNSLPPYTHSLLVVIVIAAAISMRGQQAACSSRSPSPAVAGYKALVARWRICPAVGHQLFRNATNFSATGHPRKSGGDFPHAHGRATVHPARLSSGYRARVVAERNRLRSRSGLCPVRGRFRNALTRRPQIM
jgi:hypothetical protein